MPSPNGHLEVHIHGTHPWRLRDFCVFDETGQPGNVLTLGEAKLYVRGTLLLPPADAAPSDSGDSETDHSVTSSALVRWCVRYVSEPPEVLLQTLHGNYVLPTTEDAAAAEFVEAWRLVVRAVGLTQRVLRSARTESADSLWAVARGTLPDATLQQEWPFVRGQLRALGVQVRPPPGWTPPPARRATEALVIGEAEELLGREPGTSHASISTEPAAVTVLWYLSPPKIFA